MTQDSFINSQQAYAEAALADLPDLVDVQLLSKLTNLSEQRIYSRRVQQKTCEYGILPAPFLVPGTTGLLFTRQAVIDWFLNNQGPQQIKTLSGKRGRPKGSKNRRGIGRAALEGGTR